MICNKPFSTISQDKSSFFKANRNTFKVAKQKGFNSTFLVQPISQFRTEKHFGRELRHWQYLNIFKPQPYPLHQTKSKMDTFYDVL